jgi:predicted amidohydrolase YtcJ
VARLVDPDRIVLGDIVTMDPVLPRADAMAVRAGTIVAVGSRGDAISAMPSGTPERTVGGTIVPGLIDCHLHLLWSGLKLLRIAGEAPLAATEALAALRSEPFGAPWIDGEPTLEQRVAGLRIIQPVMHALGVTTVVDPALAPAELAAYIESHRRGELTMRVVAMPHPDIDHGAAGVIAALDGLGVRTGLGDDLLRLGGAKVYFDGEGMAGSALRREPWPDRAVADNDARGWQRLPDAEFLAIADYCARSGWSLGVHVVGGGGLAAVLGAFAEVDARHPIATLGFTLIHAYLEPSPQDMALAARLGVLVAAQPAIHWSNGVGLVTRLGENARRANPIRDWLAAGVTVGGGSDGSYFDLDPRFGLWQARTRQVAGAEDPHAPELALDGEQALALYTTGAAAVALAPDRLGCLAPGHAADWTVLPLDPITAEPDALATMLPAQTAVGGRVRFEATP